MICDLSKPLLSLIVIQVLAKKIKEYILNKQEDLVYPLSFLRVSKATFLKNTVSWRMFPGRILLLPATYNSVTRRHWACDFIWWGKETHAMLTNNVSKHNLPNRWNSVCHILLYATSYWGTCFFRAVTQCNKVLGFSLLSLKENQ